MSSDTLNKFRDRNEALLARIEAGETIRGLARETGLSRVRISEILKKAHRDRQRKQTGDPIWQLSFRARSALRYLVDQHEPPSTEDVLEALKKNENLLKGLLTLPNCGAKTIKEVLAYVTRISL